MNSSIARHSVLFLVLYTLLFNACENEQQNPTPLVQSVIIKRMIDGHWQAARSEHFTYNSRGQVLTNTMQYLKDNQWVNQNRLVYRYDEASTLEIERTYESWQTEKWMPNLRFLPIRDDQNRLIEERVERQKEGQWQLSRRNTTSFLGANTKKSVQTYQNLSGSDWDNSWKDEYDYAGDKLVKKTGYQWQDGNWVNAMITEYEYNSEGSRISQKMTRVNNGVRKNHRLSRFKVDDGKKVSSKTEAFKNDQWVEDEVREFVYFEENQ